MSLWCFPREGFSATFNVKDLNMKIENRMKPKGPSLTASFVMTVATRPTEHQNPKKSDEVTKKR